MRFPSILKTYQFLLAIALVLLPMNIWAQPEGNRLVSVFHQVAEGFLTITAETEKPVGYRYTVYDLNDPKRVVVDFPGLLSGDIPSMPVDLSPVSEVRVSSLSLSSGDLTRLEVLLSVDAEYSVSLKDSEFNIEFITTDESEHADGVLTGQADKGKDEAIISPKEIEHQNMVSAAESTNDQNDVSRALAASAKLLTDIAVSGSKALLKLDGKVPEYRYFTLKNPARLVIDVYGVKTTFNVKEFSARNGFEKIRVGHYNDKTRIVFDGETTTLPEYNITDSGRALLVSWGEGGLADKVVAEAEDSTFHGPVSVEKVDFVSDDKYAMISVALSESFEKIEPVVEGNLLRFGVKNAKMGRSLRRTIDASAFPTSVLRITPYTVHQDDRQDVLIAVELKGKTSFEVIEEETLLLLKVENGVFAEELSDSSEVKEIELPVAAAEGTIPEITVQDAPSASGEGMEGGEETAGKVDALWEAPATGDSDVAETSYTGEKITLIFDQADVRQIFQLIGEVSGLNVILGDGVSGAVSLRLVDVPWDQALDLIMDIKGLDMLQKGNVLRILPKDQVRAMRQAELKAVKEEESIEPLITEVLAVSYTSLGNVSGPVGELLTERGKVTTDDRNKQLIVTDIPSVIEKARKLVAILDTPEKQVMIEARIVEAKTSFTRQLGVSWGVSYTDDTDAVGPWDASEASVAGGGSFVISPTVGTSGIGSSITFGSLGITSTVLDLKISAAETSGDSKVISKPRVTTLNGETASISQGTQIPYQSVGDSGTKTEFVDATLELSVTPIINPDDSVILEINASNNTPTQVAGASAPAIDKKEAKTKVLVKDGETTVIGGIFVENESASEAGIPILRHIPILGNLFKSKTKDESRNELLIFITPRILN